MVTIILITLISLFPIVLWAYAFSYVDNNPINKKRFLIGVLWWALSVFPILYMERVIDIFKIDYLNIFYFVYNLKGIFSTLEFWISLSVFLLFLVLVSFFLWGFVHKFKAIFIHYIRNIVVFLFLILFLSLFIFIFNYLSTFVNFSIDMGWAHSVVFWDMIFNTFKLIVFYYLLVAFIEETSKHFNFIQSSILYIDSIKTWVLYAIFVALWFSLVENVLYLYSIYSSIGMWSELLYTYFFRSVFSVMVHVLASSVVAYYFSKALLLFREKDLSLPYLKVFLTWLFISILLHLVFDVAITMWYSFVIILYFIGWYLYVSSIFYRE